ncbi:MAG TPA: hypothetical protein VHC69_28810 [Polyangiaceae bacterium]|nr:hypothetical protein [Polyangiaceae bacterium]
MDASSGTALPASRGGAGVPLAASLEGIGAASLEGVSLEGVGAASLEMGGDPLAASFAGGFAPAASCDAPASPFAAPGSDAQPLGSHVKLNGSVPQKSGSETQAPLPLKAHQPQPSTGVQEPHDVY